MMMRHVAVPLFGFGIEASFWDKETDADPDILPLPARGE